MRPVKLIAILVASTALSGCGGLFGGGRFTLPSLVENKPVPITIVQPTPMELNDVTWKVYTPETLAAEVQQAPTGTVYYVLTQDEYNVLAMNLSEMRRYIEDQSAVNATLINAIKINEGERTPAVEVSPPAARPAQ
jgi:hypothetical protein